LIVHSKLEQTSPFWSGLKKLLQFRKILFVLIFILGCWCGVVIDQWRKERYIAFSALDIGDLYKYYTNINNILIRPEWAPPQLDFDIKFKNFLRLEFFRKRTLDAMAANMDLLGNISPQENKRYVKALLRVAHGERFPVKVRLKGIGRFHYKDEKWSMRVSIRGRNNFLGMKEFSLTHPKRRAMFVYWLLNQTLKREGLISLRTPLVSVSINGKGKGIYAVEEIPRKELIVNNQRREGLIVRFNQIQAEEYVSYSGTSLDHFYNSSELLFQIKTKEVNDQNLKQFETATSLLESFRLGHLKASEVFNVKRYATYLAICDTMNAWHGASWPNMRFYFDPVLAKFEPIPWDLFDEDNLDHGIDRMFRMDDLYNESESAFFLNLFDDPIFVREYISELVRISSDEYADKLFEDLKGEIEAYRYILHKDHPLKSIPKDIERLYKHREHIRKNYLEKAGLLSSQIVKLGENEIILKLDSTSAIPLDVIGVEIDGKILFHPDSGTVSIPGIHQRKETSRTVRFIPEEEKHFGELNTAKLFVSYQLLGINKLRRAILNGKEMSK
jgi:hypothetical protein